MNSRPLFIIIFMNKILILDTYSFLIKYINEVWISGTLGVKAEVFAFEFEFVTSRSKQKVENDNILYVYNTNRWDFEIPFMCKI